MESTQQTMKAVVFACQDRVTVDIIRAHRREVLNEVMAKILPRLAPGWTVLRAESSTVFRSRKGSVSIKITSSSEVFLDRRLKDLSYKSKAYREASPEAAASRLLEVIGPHLIHVPIHESVQ